MTYEMAPDTAHDKTDETTDDEKRQGQRTLAPKSSESEAAPHIAAQEADRVIRIDAADTAAVRPEHPDKQL